MFTIRKENITRTFNKTPYNSRVLMDDGIYYPIGYQNNINEEI